MVGFKLGWKSTFDNPVYRGPPRSEYYRKTVAQCAIRSLCVRGEKFATYKAGRSRTDQPTDTLGDGVDGTLKGYQPGTDTARRGNGQRGR